MLEFVSTVWFAKSKKAREDSAAVLRHRVSELEAERRELLELLDGFAAAAMRDKQECIAEIERAQRFCTQAFITLHELCVSLAK